MCGKLSEENVRITEAILSDLFVPRAYCSREAGSALNSFQVE